MVRLVKIGATRSIPEIKTNMESPCLTPFLDTMNNPTIKGIINNKTKTSNLNWIANEVNPIQNSSELKFSEPAIPKILKLKNDKIPSVTKIIAR